MAQQKDRMVNVDKCTITIPYHDYKRIQMRLEAFEELLEKICSCYDTQTAGNGFVALDREKLVALANQKVLPGTEFESCTVIYKN